MLESGKWWSFFFNNKNKGKFKSASPSEILNYICSGFSSFSLIHLIKRHKGDMSANLVDVLSRRSDSTSIQHRECIEKILDERWAIWLIEWLIGWLIDWLIASCSYIFNSFNASVNKFFFFNHEQIYWKSRPFWLCTSSWYGVIYNCHSNIFEWRVGCQYTWRSHCQNFPTWHRKIYSCKHACDHYYILIIRFDHTITTIVSYKL